MLLLTNSATTQFCSTWTLHEGSNFNRKQARVSRFSPRGRYVTEAMPATLLPYAKPMFRNVACPPLRGNASIAAVTALLLLERCHRTGAKFDE